MTAEARIHASDRRVYGCAVCGIEFEDGGEVWYGEVWEPACARCTRDWPEPVRWPRPVVIEGGRE